LQPGEAPFDIGVDQTAMHPRRAILAFTAAIALGGPVAAAHAAWYPPQAIDGPNADVQQIGGIDLARDGTGALVYIRDDGGVPHVFISRLFNGAWSAPTRVDSTVGAAATEAKVAVADGNRVAVAWIADGVVYGASAPVNATPAPLSAASPLGGPGAQDVDLDVGVNDAGYAVWQQGGDVDAVRLQDASWSGLAAPLDIAPSDQSGVGADRPRVAVGADGNAVVVWGEVSGGVSVIFERRLTGTALSQVPQQVSAPGGNADSPDLDIEDDSSFAWVVYRQDTAGGSHSFVRRLVGSQFDPGGEIDGGVVTSAPRIDMNGTGQGEAVEQSYDNGVFGSLLDHDQFAANYQLNATGSPVASAPQPFSADRGDIAVAWSQGSEVHARIKEYREPFAADTVVGGGPVADPGAVIGGDRVGDLAVAWVQGTPGAQALVVANYDHAPSAPFIAARTTYTNKTRPRLLWSAALDLWGPLTYRVMIDGQQVAQTANTQLIPRTPLKTGRHSWQIFAVDARGQISHSRLRTIKVDATAPAIKVKVAGKRAAGQTLKIKVTALDHGGSGLDHTTLDFGDHSATTRSRTVSHRYAAGSYTLKVAAVDRAGNIGHATVKLKIKK